MARLEDKRTAARAPAAAIVAVLVSVSNALSQERDREPGPGTAGFCGPRSVQHILSMHGRDCDLIEIIKETQWPDFSRGASMAALNDALVKRGVYTYPCRIAAVSQLDGWPSPCLLRFRGGGESHEGHFAVWLPDADACSLWGWVAGSGGEVPYEAVSAHFSGEVILTSPKPIDEEDVKTALAGVPTNPRMRRGWVAAFAVGMALVVGWRYLRPMTWA